MRWPIKFTIADDPEDDRTLFSFGGHEHKAVEKEVAHESHAIQKAKQEFVLEWDKALGFSENPFVDKHFTPASKFIAGYQEEKRKLNLFVINENKFGTILGEEGVGKTVLLSWLFEKLSEFKHKMLPVYIKGDAKNPQAVLSDIVIELMNPYEKTVKKGKLKLTLDGFAVWIKKKAGKRKLILLLDGCKRVTAKDLQLFSTLYKICPCLIIAADSKENYDKSAFKDVQKVKDVNAENFKDTLKMVLDGLPYSEMEELMEKRIEHVGGHGILPFSESVLKQLHKRAKKNPKILLELCKKKAIELTVKNQGVDQDMTKEVEEKEQDLTKDTNEEKKASEDQIVHSSEHEVTPTQKGEDYKIAVVNRNEDFVMVEDKEKKDSSYKVEHK
ncbi:MAG: ATP-binding protein [Candidatus Woesearchaeota archaeon]|nr:ATP-binding protein [Candidatus Woesearchaeota archaeon]MDP7458012.1 ATP-binding protein [Candidatus Woesearchaeota archaeon]